MEEHEALAHRIEANRAHLRDPIANPEHEALLADSVGLALLVVLDTLAPAERLAFVLHDMFAMPFDEIAPIVGRSPTAARQLASRAPRRVRFAQAALVDGAVGIILAPRGRLVRVLRLSFAHGKIAEVEVVGDPER